MITSLARDRERKREDGREGDQSRSHVTSVTPFLRYYTHRTSVRFPPQFISISLSPGSLVSNSSASGVYEVSGHGRGKVPGNAVMIMS